MLKISRLLVSLTAALTVCLILSTGICAAAPRRIAVLPIYCQSGHAFSHIEAYLQEELDKNLHIPLNGTLNIAEFVPDDEIEAALFAIHHQKPTGAFLQLVAERVRADIAVCLVVQKAYEYRIPRFDETYMVSGLSLELIVYDNKLLPSTRRYKASDSYYDTFSANGTLLALTENTAYQLFRKANLKQTLFPLQLNQK